MTSFLDRTVLVTAAVAASGFLILILIGQSLSNALPSLPSLKATDALSAMGPTNRELPGLFSSAVVTQTILRSNLPAPFETDFFRPPPPPPAVVKKTRKVDVTYSGYTEATTGEKRAYVLVDGKLSILPPGATVLSDVTISNILRTELILSRAPTQEVVVPFRGHTQIEVPLE